MEKTKIVINSMLLILIFCFNNVFSPIFKDNEYSSTKTEKNAANVEAINIVKIVTTLSEIYLDNFSPVLKVLLQSQIVINTVL